MLPAAAPTELHVLSIFDIITAEDGTSRYITSDASNIGSTDSIPKSSIAAICTGHTQSRELGAFITFALSVKGILSLLVLPCVILLIFLIVRIASSRSTDEEEDDDFDFYEYDEEEKQNDAFPQEEATKRTQILLSLNPRRKSSRATNLNARRCLSQRISARSA